MPAEEGPARRHPGVRHHWDTALGAPPPRPFGAPLHSSHIYITETTTCF